MSVAQTHRLVFPTNFSAQLYTTVQLKKQASPAGKQLQLLPFFPLDHFGIALTGKYSSHQTDQHHRAPWTQTQTQTLSGLSNSAQ